MTSAGPARTGLPEPGWIRRALEAERAQPAHRNQDGQDGQDGQDTTLPRSHGTILVASASQPGTTYAVRFDGPNRVCDCPSFENRGICRHVSRVNDALRQLTTPPDDTPP